MPDKTGFLLFALISVLATGPGTVASEEDEVYLCEDADGSVILQTDPCPETIEAEKSPATTVSPTSARQPPEAASVPPPVRQPPARIERDPLPPARRSTGGWTVIPRSPSPVRPARTGLGRQSFPTTLAGIPGSASPSFESPETTWRNFVAAIEGGDRAAAGQCLTPAALEKLGPDVESIPLEHLRSMVNEFTRIENGGDLGPFWSIYGIRPKRPPKWIFFEKDANGEWKIAGI